MSGYVCVFDSVYDGSLAGRWPALPVWLSLLPMADRYGRIDKTPEVISRATGWPLDLLKQGINELMQPDPGSRCTREEGRRLVLIDPARSWGWRVVNRDMYREKARKIAYEDTRARTSAGSRDLPRSSAGSRENPLSESKSKTESKKDRRQQIGATASRRALAEPPEFATIRAKYPSRAGGQRWGDAVKAYRRRIAEGATPAEIIAGVERYAEHARAMGIEKTSRVQQAATFLGDNRGYLEPWPVESTTPGTRPAAPPKQPAGRDFRPDDNSLDGLDV